MYYRFQNNYDTHTLNKIYVEWLMIVENSITCEVVQFSEQFPEKKY